MIYFTERRWFLTEISTTTKINFFIIEYLTWLDSLVNILKAMITAKIWINTTWTKCIKCIKRIVKISSRLKQLLFYIPRESDTSVDMTYFNLEAHFENNFRPVFDCFKELKTLKHPSGSRRLFCEIICIRPHKKKITDVIYNQCDSASNTVLHFV